MLPLHEAFKHAYVLGRFVQLLTEALGLQYKQLVWFELLELVAPFGSWLALKHVPVAFRSVGSPPVLKHVLPATVQLPVPLQLRHVPEQE